VDTISSNKTIVFCDGASLGNPGPGGWGAIIIGSNLDAIELGGGEANTTNNRMEMTAAISALEHAKNDKKQIEIYSDSKYLIKGITEWIEGWVARGWKNSEGNSVANEDLWQRLNVLTKEIRRYQSISWIHIPGHAGIAGNERADEIAVAFAKGLTPVLYKGRLENYRVDILNLKASLNVKDRSNKGKRAYSYLSLVDNVLLRHTDWSSCERRVRGRSNAKYKKATSPAEEEEIVKAWGFSKEELQNG